MSPIHIVHLYAQEMNIYGDTGNTIVLQKRLQWRNIPVKVSVIGIGEKLPANTDILIAGGGQDAVQSSIQGDLLKKGKELKAMADEGMVVLLICGSYQLFGRRFITHKNEEIKGIGILPLETKAGPERLIGNMIYKTKWGKVVGYENHSGLTMLDDKSLALGKVIKGKGNNGQDRTEGVVYKNIFGTYSHGPVLSKNPHFADELLRRAVERKNGQSGLTSLDDKLELKAALVASLRPR
ncbi:MAG TPA: glutamine amidotransferase [Candidatus Saccharimonadales bacterium]|nr:glutamine amidotransferase [Candidatus Saccharimonadales bacterium]